MIYLYDKYKCQVVVSLLMCDNNVVYSIVFERAHFLIHPAWSLRQMLWMKDPFKLTIYKVLLFITQNGFKVICDITSKQKSCVDHKSCVKSFI